ncbi:hypothetical protein GWK47_008600 [Chionoecetes opilio]|uniref:MMS22-like C-terminal domain-containing protein n=1 Tax=Chionoecetes opilio TaxID=41210 RepID=A0A8J4Y3L7_CHIOP|nr:hypothetical protein GWK47_008600 [Chionoecetes opilio]
MKVSDLSVGHAKIKKAFDQIRVTRCHPGYHTFRCSLQYASCVLGHPGSLAVLSTLSPGHERLLVSGWLCGLVGVGGEGEVVDTLTLQIVKLPCVAAVMPPTPPADPYAVAACFIRGVAAKFASIQTFGDRMAYREEVLQCFSGLEKALGSLLKKSPPATHLPQALSFIANLFFHAPAVIYIKSRPTCPMAALLNTVLLPTPIYSPDKPLSAAFTASISSVLPQTSLPCIYSPLVHCYVGEGALTSNPNSFFPWKSKILKVLDEPDSKGDWNLQNAVSIWCMQALNDELETDLVEKELEGPQKMSKKTMLLAWFSLTFSDRSNPFSTKPVSNSSFKPACTRLRQRFWRFPSSLLSFMERYED